MNARELLWCQLTLLLKVIEGFDGCNVFISALELSTFIFYILLYLLIDLLPLTPRGCATALVGEFICSQFFSLSFWVCKSGSTCD